MENKYLSTNLNRGGKLFYVKNNVNKNTVIDVLFNCGSRCENITGLAHFCEHMFFTGTKTMNKEQITQKYYSFIVCNAYTNLREIVFTGEVFAKELEEYLKTISTMINESTFKQEAVDKERKIINQEIAEYEDKHQDIAHGMNLYNLFKQPIFKEKASSAGNKSSIAKITSKDVKKYIKHYFVANNLEVYITSPMSLNKVKKLINKNLSNKLPVNDKLEPLPYNFYDVAESNFVKTTKAEIDKIYIALNFTFPKAYDDYNFMCKFEMMRAIINDPAIGLAKILRLQKSLVYSAWFSYWRFKQNSVLALYCECEKENVNEIITTVADYIKNIIKNGFSKDDLNKAKRQYKHAQMRKNPSAYSLINKLYDYRFEGKILNKKEMEKLKNKTTVDDCNNIFKEVFANSKVSLSLYGSFDKENIITKKQLNELFKIN